MKETEYDYLEPSFFRNAWNVFLHGRIRKEKLICDIHMGKFSPNILRQHDFPDYQGYIRSERWTDRRGSELRPEGYLKAVGLHDSIIWAGIPVYMRISGGTVADLNGIRDEEGMRIFSMDSAATLNDAMQSNATADFMKGLGKASTTMRMDIQKIAMIGVLAVGAVFGLFMLGVF